MEQHEILEVPTLQLVIPFPHEPVQTDMFIEQAQPRTTILVAAKQYPLSVKFSSGFFKENPTKSPT